MFQVPAHATANTQCQGSQRFQHPTGHAPPSLPNRQQDFRTWPRLRLQAPASTEDAPPAKRKAPAFDRLSTQGA